MSALKRRKVSESFTEEKKQPKPSKKTLDRIDDTEVNQTSSQPLSQVAQEKSLKKRKLENEEADEGIEEKEEKVEESEEAEEAKKKKKSFEDLGIIPELAQACESLGYKHPTPIQQEAIPLALQGRDLIGLAETGSGKTAAFALPILQSLMEKPSPLFGLVIAPTRELAYQISEQFEALGSLISVRTAVIVGGMDMVSQSIALGKKPHILIATPGRLLDHLENTKGFSLRTLKWLVLDEADRLLDLDFGEIISKILKNIPSERRTMLFSATISSKVEHLQRASLSNPLRVSISSSSYATVKTLMQSYIFIPHKFKDTYLVYLLNEHAGQSCILFTRTVNETARLAFLLRALGFSALPLHGQLSQTQRLGALNKFRAGGREIMVATDVAARGLDIPSVDLVINFDLPPDSKTYVHRVGRTARAGKAGVAISLVTQYDVEIYQRIEKALDKKLPEHHAPRDEVLIFSEKVAEAQRVAIREMKDMHEKAKGKGGPRAFKGKGNRRDGMDKDEG